MKHIILPGLTTTKKSYYKEKIREIDDFGIKEISLFPTWLNDVEKRKELYVLLEKTGLEKIPHVHVTDNVEEWELDYYTKYWKTGLFNIHINQTTRGLLDRTKYRDNIFIETTDDIDDFFIESLDYCGGLCLDAAHAEDRGNKEQYVGYDKIPKLLEKYKVGCAHISGIKDYPVEYIHYITKKKYMNWSNHYVDDMRELDYVKKYVQYLPEYVSIELENTFSEQLKIKEYLEKIINTQ